MAFDNQDELNRRREEREFRRKQQEAEQRKLKVKLGIAAAILIGCIAGIVAITGGDRPAEASLETEAATEATTEATAEPEETETVLGTEVIHIRAAGDLNVTDSVILAGAGGGAGTGGYDFTVCFQDVASTLSDADMTILNLEGNLCGEPYGSTTTSAPNQLAQALKAAGVDMVQMANSCSVNNGISGLATTLNALRNAGLEPVGAYANSQEFSESKGYTLVEIGDITVAIVAFTKGVGSRGLPVGSEDCVNLLYTDYATTYEDIDTDGIKAVLKRVASENPDITIAMLHWGSEYNDSISSSQKKIVTLMQQQGVDVIIGTHPHMVHPIDYDAATGNLVAYSLGDFLGDATRAGTNYSIILDLEITKDYASETTRVTGYSYIPVYTVTEEESADSQRRVVRIEEAIEAYEKNYVNKVSKSCYDSMVYGLERIEDRVIMKTEEDD